MTQFYVDDGLINHHKARSAGLEAMGLWVMAGSYSGQQLTEGFVPEWLVKGFPRGPRLAAKLVEVGLWEVGTHEELGAGWRFHEWSKVNRKTKAIVQAEREANLTRQRRHRDKEKSNDERNAVTNATHSTPLHTTDRQDTYSDPHVPDRPSSPQDEDGSGDKCLGSIIAAVAEATGRTIGSFGAVDVRDWIDERRGRGKAPVKNPSSYYATAIRNDRFEVQQFIDERNIAS